MQQFLSRRNFAFGLTAIGAYLTGCKSGIAAAKVKMPGAPSPPMAPAALKFGAARSDPYNWLRNREDPRVVAYLNEPKRSGGTNVYDTVTAVVFVSSGLDQI